jgi:hypothetical protein
MSENIVTQDLNQGANFDESKITGGASTDTSTSSAISENTRSGLNTQIMLGDETLTDIALSFFFFSWSNRPARFVNLPSPPAYNETNYTYRANINPNSSGQICIVEALIGLRFSDYPANPVKYITSGYATIGGNFTFGSWCLDFQYYSANSLLKGDRTSLGTAANATPYWNSSGTLTQGTLPVVNGGSGATSVNAAPWKTKPSSYPVINGSGSVTTRCEIIRFVITGNNQTLNIDKSYYSEGEILQVRCIRTITNPTGIIINGGTNITIPTAALNTPNFIVQLVKGGTNLEYDCWWSVNV